MNKLVLTAGATLVAVASVHSASAQAATLQRINQVDLAFFNESSNTVGSGQFRYPLTPFEGSFRGSNPAQPVTIDAGDNLHLVTSLAIELDLYSETLEGSLSFNYSLNDLANTEALFWQPVPSPGDPFSVVFDFMGNVSLEKVWLLGDDFARGSLPEKLLSINDSRRWDLAFLPVASEENFQGTWEVTSQEIVAIPEPLTIGGSLIALGLGVYLKRRKHP